MITFCSELLLMPICNILKFKHMQNNITHTEDFQRMFIKRKLYRMIFMTMCLISPYSVRTSGLHLYDNSSLWWDNWAFLIGSTFSLASCSLYAAHNNFDKNSNVYQCALSVITLAGGFLFHHYRAAFKESCDYIQAIPGPLKGLFVVVGVYLFVNKIQNEREKSALQKRLLSDEDEILRLLKRTAVFDTTEAIEQRILYQVNQKISNVQFDIAILNQTLNSHKDRTDSIIKYILGMGKKVASLQELLHRQKALISLCDSYQELLDDVRYKEVMQQAEVIERSRQKLNQ